MERKNKKALVGAVLFIIFAIFMVGIVTLEISNIVRLDKFCENNEGYVSGLSECIIDRGLYRMVYPGYIITKNTNIEFIKIGETTKWKKKHQ